jgi:hypothetical protein
MVFVALRKMVPGWVTAPKQRSRPAWSKRTFTPRLEPLEDRWLPAQVFWVNPAGGDWNEPSNWSTGMLPGPADDVSIDVPSAEVTITHSTGLHGGKLHPESHEPGSDQLHRRHALYRHGFDNQ